MKSDDQTSSGASIAPVAPTVSRWKSSGKILRYCGEAVVALLAAAWIGLKFVPLPASLQTPVPLGHEPAWQDGFVLHESQEVPLSDIPKNLIEATLAAEDKRFFDHKGVDVLALGRALFDNVVRRRVTSGASTITQQLVKISDPRPRTMWAKLVETARALRLEQLWTKDQILAAYLNRLDFGNANIGVAAATEYYFGKPMDHLGAAEAAFLAGLPNNPTQLNPYARFDRAKRRQEIVLHRMQADGWLSERSTFAAIHETLHLQPRRHLSRTPHFVEIVELD